MKPSRPSPPLIGREVLHLPILLSFIPLLPHPNAEAGAQSGSDIHDRMFLIFTASTQATPL